jgi:hypothetical protein
MITIERHQQDQWRFISIKIAQDSWLTLGVMHTNYIPENLDLNKFSVAPVAFTPNQTSVRADYCTPDALRTFQEALA